MAGYILFKSIEIKKLLLSISTSKFLEVLNPIFEYPPKIYPISDLIIIKTLFYYHIIHGKF